MPYPGVIFDPYSPNTKAHNMKYLVVLLSSLALVSCGSDSEKTDSEDGIPNKTEEKLEKVQQDNITLEQMDGELDSLLNEIE